MALYSGTSLSTICPAAKQSLIRGLAMGCRPAPETTIISFSILDDGPTQRVKN